MHDLLVLLLPKEYRKAVLRFNKSWVKKQHSPKKMNSLLQTFSEKYTMLPHWWDMWISLIRWNLITEGESKDFTKNAKEIETKSLKHFPEQLKLEWPTLDKKIFFNKSKTLEELLEYVEFLLSFPHSMLPLALITFKELSTKVTAIPKNLQKHTENLEIYKEMHGADIKDGEKYIEILKKTKNDEFVIKNIECKLAKNPWCQNLWIAYIHFLEAEKKDKMALLSVLKRYCRFFISDKKMKENYQTKIEEFSPNLNGISEFWIDSIKFELQFYGKNSAIKMVEKALDSKMKDISEFFDAALDLTKQFRQTQMTEKIEATKKLYMKKHPFISEYNFQKVIKSLSFDDSIKMQKLPFSKPINRYLYDKFDYFHLRKLYQICKWFYYKYRLNLVHKLEIEKRCRKILGKEFLCGIHYVKYRDDSLMLSPCKVDNIPDIKNLWLTNSLNVTDCKKMSHLFQKISKVTLKYLELCATNISKNEFEILTISKTIIVLDLSQNIKDKNGQNMVVEDILKNFPNVRQIKIDPAYSTPNTAEAMLTLKFNDKFDFINLNFKPQINAEMYFEFLEKNLQDKSHVCLHCITTDTDYQNAMKQYFSKWHPKCGTPTLRWS